MELADCSLADHLRECQRAGLSGIPKEELLGYTFEAAEALDFLHANNVIHRAVKPSNLLLVRDHVKVADFLLSRALGSRPVTAPVLGAPVYMPPEAWLGREVKESDQYSLAVCYAEMRQGRLPFRAFSPLEWMTQHRSTDPDLEGIPDTERPILRRALARDPSARFKSNREFTEDLCRAAGGPSITFHIRSRDDNRASWSGVAFTPQDPPQPLAAPDYTADDNVQFTVYRPGMVVPGRWYDLLAFAHLSERRPDAPDEPDPVEEVRRQA
jgi:serine/threonine protein kinase